LYFDEISVKSKRENKVVVAMRLAWKASEGNVQNCWGIHAHLTVSGAALILQAQR
jgi:hypothetical protein